MLKIDKIHEILTAVRYKRNECSTKYNRRLNIIGVIDNCLDDTAIGLDTIGVRLLSTIVAAPAVSGIEAVLVAMGLIRVVGNRATKMLTLKIAKHEKIAMIAVSALNTISSLILKALSDDFI